MCAQKQKSIATTEIMPTKLHTYVTVPGKRAQVVHIMNFCIGGFSAASLGTKLLCLSQKYLPLFANTHAKFESVEALLKGQARRQLLKSSFSHYDLNVTG